MVQQMFLEVFWELVYDVTLICVLHLIIEIETRPFDDFYAELKWAILYILWGE